MSLRLISSGAGGQELELKHQSEFDLKAFYDKREREVIRPPKVYPPSNMVKGAISGVIATVILCGMGYALWKLWPVGSWIVQRIAEAL